MPFVPTEVVLDVLRQVLEERYDLRRKELTNGPERPPSVKKWSVNDFDFPEGADRGDYAKGIVSFDPERTCERREQDSGETARIGVKIRIYFSPGSMSAADMETNAIRYGDGLLWTLMREAKVVRPADATVLPGLFRIWPSAMRVGQAKGLDLYGCEVDAEMILDSSFQAAVTP